MSPCQLLSSVWGIKNIFLTKNQSSTIFISLQFGKYTSKSAISDLILTQKLTDYN